MIYSIKHATDIGQRFNILYWQLFVATPQNTPIIMEGRDRNQEDLILCSQDIAKTKS